MELIAVTYKGKVIHLTLKDFLAQYIILIQIDNRLHDYNKGVVLRGNLVLVTHHGFALDLSQVFKLAFKREGQLIQEF